jgi:hypothetical protein
MVCWGWDANGALAAVMSSRFLWLELFDGVVMELLQH